MRQPQLFLLAGLMLLLFSEPTTAQSRETRVEQEHYRDYDERNDPKDYLPGGKDWVVLFTYPERGRNVRVIAYGNKERAVLSGSETNYSFYENGRRYVKVLTGSGARRRAEYAGTRHDWARSLRLEYMAPFEPRGPSRPRRPPR